MHLIIFAEFLLSLVRYWAWILCVAQNTCMGILCVFRYGCEILYMICVCVCVCTCMSVCTCFGVCKSITYMTQINSMSELVCLC